MPGLIDHVAERNRATIINALESVLGHAAHDLFRQVSRVVFGVAFQHRFQNDALRASRDNFRCRHQFHAVPLQLSLVPGTVVAVPGKAVKFPDQHNVKQPLFAVLYHLLELRTIVSFSGKGAVDVVLDDGDAVLFRIGRAFTNLAFNGFFALVVAGIAGVDHGGHGGHLPFIHH